MREVWVMRSGLRVQTSNPSFWHPRVPLSREGLHVVREVARKLLAGIGFSHVGYSPYEAAPETAQIISRAVGTLSIEEDDGLAPTFPGIWDFIGFYHPTLKSAKTAADYFEADMGLIALEGKRMFQKIHEIAESLHYDEERAILVSHSPLIEAAAAYGTQTWPPVHELEPGEILVFPFDGKRLHEIRHILLPETATTISGPTAR